MKVVDKRPMRGYGKEYEPPRNYIEFSKVPMYAYFEDADGCKGQKVAENLAQWSGDEDTWDDTDECVLILEVELHIIGEKP